MPIVRIAFGMIFAIMPYFSSAQSAGAGQATVFQSQLIDLHTKAISILNRVEKATPHGAAQVEFDEEIAALTSLVFRLEEEAGKSDLQMVKLGQPPNKRLLMVAQASKALDGMLSALGDYVNTEDRAFLGFAKDNNALVFAIRKVM